MKKNKPLHNYLLAIPFLLNPILNIVTPSRGQSPLEDKLAQVYRVHEFKDLDKDYKSGAEIIEVPEDQMPEGVLGMYSPKDHKIYLKKDQPARERMTVHAHESIHARGIINEFRTDSLSQSESGYNFRAIPQQYGISS